MFMLGSGDWLWTMLRFGGKLGDDEGVRNRVHKKNDESITSHACPTPHSWKQFRSGLDPVHSPCGWAGLWSVGFAAGLGPGSGPGHGPCAQACWYSGSECGPKALSVGLGHCRGSGLEAWAWVCPWAWKAMHIERTDCRANSLAGTISWPSVLSDASVHTFGLGFRFWVHQFRSVVVDHIVSCWGWARALCPQCGPCS